MLVPMLQALHLHSPMLPGETQTELLNTLAQIRCELGSRKHPEDVTTASLASLHTLRIVFNSTTDQNRSQRILNHRSYPFTLEEAKVLYKLRHCSDYICSHSFRFGENDMYDNMLNRLADIEHCDVTNEVLRVGIVFLPQVQR